MRPLVLTLMLLLAPPVWAFDVSDELIARYERAVSETEARHDSCSPNRDVLRKGRVDMVVAYGADPTEIEVTIGDRMGDTHLFLYSSEPRHWLLAEGHGDRLRSITVFGGTKALVSGFADGTDIFAMTGDARGNRRVPCEPEDEAQWLLTQTLHYFQMDERNLPNLENWLKQATDQTLSALVMNSWEASEVRVDWAARNKTESMRKVGAQLQLALVPPVAFDPMAEALALPAGLSGAGITDWLLEAGATVAVDDDMLAFLCLRERADAMALGLRALHDPFSCRAEERMPRDRQFILLRSLNVGDFYECNFDQGPILHIPRGIEVTGAFVNCSVPLFQM
ncbi:MAG: hypothetical protein ACU0GG_03835 [Paracoccaceae bacterium]